MVLYTNEKIGKIAISVGFPSASILRRHYIDLFSLSPEEERKRVNLFELTTTLQYQRPSQITAFNAVTIA